MRQAVAGKRTMSMVVVPALRLWSLRHRQRRLEAAVGHREYEERTAHNPDLDSSANRHCGSHLKHMGTV
jgi:hypothetical protein